MRATAATRFQGYATAAKEMMTVREAMNSVFDEEMSGDPRVFLMGEEMETTHNREGRIGWLRV